MVLQICCSDRALLEEDDRSGCVAQPHTDTLVSPQRALQRGHPQKTPTAMWLLLSWPPLWVCGGAKDMAKDARGISPSPHFR